MPSISVDAVDVGGAGEPSQYDTPIFFNDAYRGIDILQGGFSKHL